MKPTVSNAPRKLVVLGATGSIGRSTADLVEASPDLFEVEAVAGGRDAAALAAMAIRLGARFAAIRDERSYSDLKAALAGTGIEAGAGETGVVEAALRPADVVVGAIVGTAGVIPTHAAVAAGRVVALANKECLVSAGAPFMREVARAGTTLLPLDSEHDAIWQALGGAEPKAVEKLTITASGGPFRTWDAQRIANATCDEALKHPNWSMGPKITVDSASMMNKGLELIEAHHLFAVEADRFDVLVHPQSIVHGMVSFADGSVIACLYCPDMKVPIAHCLGHPHRIRSGARTLDLAELGSLTFERADLERFPALRVAMEALRHGGGLPTVLNAANEIAVAAFLAREIPFSAIASVAHAACEAAVANGIDGEPATITEALGVDHVARERARAYLAEHHRSGMVTVQ